MHVASVRSHNGGAATEQNTSITKRVEIREDVQAGRIPEAVEKTNDLDPEILETQTDLYLDLQLQQLTELICGGQVEQALQFAQLELAPLCMEQQSTIEALESVMALLAFDNREASPLAHLVHGDQRREVASRLNKAILSSLRKEQEPRLPSILQTVAWAQHMCVLEGSSCPKFDPKDLTFTFDSSEEESLDE
eukprot:TRINITY_DN15916_c0_g1_i3.p1 TRINITY_DN15916_c0_g1~~TRINITY_DN15916_c0_g1_i3.p1  ORF type:complete len:193 (-),score=37.18 TRINITY_DN15916_c0_g1_i3:265-843(-)